MDDPPFHCNKSTIYVLNTNYNYGNFGGLNTDLASRPFFSYQSPDHLLPGKIGNSDNYSGSTNNSSGNSSSSSSSCGVGALANFFPCSNAFGHLQQQQRNKFFNFQHHHHHSQQQQQQQQQSLFRQHLLKDQPLISNTITNGTAALGSNLCISPATAALLGQNKKLPPIKSTIIEKKTKFWKFLEEEKWKKNSLENFSNSNCERTNSSNNGNNDKKSEPARGHLNLHIRNDTSSGMDSESTASTTTSILLNSDNNNDCNGKNNCCNFNSNVKQTTATTSSTSNSTMDLYREAVQLLGLSCTLCDNCRCIDCQSRYFECDDDFDCDDSLEDCFDTFGHFDGGSFNIEPEPTYDIHGLYQFNSNINNNNNNNNNNMDNNYNNNYCSNNSNNRCGGITTRSPPDECLENNCHYKSTSPTSSLLSSSSSSTSTLSETK